MAVFSLPTPPPLRPPVIDTTDLNGEDVAFGLSGSTGYTVGPNGDWVSVTGPAAALQSVVRELPNRQGSLARRPSWGGGMVDQVFRNMTQDTLNAIVARVTACMKANPRVGKIVSVVGFNSYPSTQSQASSAIGGTTVPAGTTAIRVEFIPAGAQAPVVTVLKPNTVTFK
jgi:hypothetical protein